jgi:hypothetical protein
MRPKVAPVYPGAPLPENPGTFPGAPLPEKPPAEVLQAQSLAQGGRPAVDPAAALGRIPARPIPANSGVPAAAPQPVAASPISPTEAAPAPYSGFQYPKEAAMNKYAAENPNVIRLWQEGTGFEAPEVQDIGNQARATTERGMGGPLPRGGAERRAIPAAPEVPETRVLVSRHAIQRTRNFPIRQAQPGPCRITGRKAAKACLS